MDFRYILLNIIIRYKVLVPLMNAKNYQTIFGSIRHAKLGEIGVNFADIQETIIDLLDEFMN